MAAWKRASKAKVDTEKWDQYLAERARLIRSRDQNRIPLKQVNGQTMYLIRLNDQVKIDALDERFQKLFRTWLE